VEQIFPHRPSKYISDTGDMMLMWWNSFTFFIIFSRFLNAKADDSSGLMTRVGEFGTRQFIRYVIDLHNEELRDLYSSPSIIRIIKSRRMRWAGHVARIGEKENAY
jgi:hypothetical protein